MLLSLCVLAAVCCACGAHGEKVFGVGLSKTGTTSIAAAVKLLGYRTVHYDHRFVPFMLGNHSRFSIAQHYADVDAVFDLPTALYFRELLAAFPTAKFVLSLRDPEAWYESYRSHRQLYQHTYSGCPLPSRMRLIGELAYGGGEDNKTAWVSHFENHNRAVLHHIPAPQLLLLDISKEATGWEKLCAFLDQSGGPCARPFPPFPTENARTERASNDSVPKTALNSTTSAPSRRALVCFVGHANSAPGQRRLRECIAARRRIALLNDLDMLAMLFKDSTSLETLEKMLKPRGLGVFVARKLFKRDFPLFAAQTLSKLRVFELSGLYKRVAFFNPDTVHATAELIEAFSLHTNLDFEGRRSENAPLDIDLFFVRPSICILNDLSDMLRTLSYEEDSGWFGTGPLSVVANSSLAESVTQSWRFPGAQGEVGIILFYFFHHLHGANSVLHSRLWLR
eukprot:m.42035 g.42035  ORF g.42035 m.42035 type:complete len:452 (-) comp46326_c0_seq1:39-1394(-)